MPAPSWDGGSPTRRTAGGADHLRVTQHRAPQAKRVRPRPGRRHVHGDPFLDRRLRWTRRRKASGLLGLVKTWGNWNVDAACARVRGGRHRTHRPQDRERLSLRRHTGHRARRRLRAGPQYFATTAPKRRHQPPQGLRDQAAEANVTSGSRRACSSYDGDLRPAACATGCAPCPRRVGWSRWRVATPCGAASEHLEQAASSPSRTGRELSAQRRREEAREAAHLADAGAEKSNQRYLKFSKVPPSGSC